ncbi:MAG: class II aldolase/adducin family protein [Microcoleaceae cyanobacterium]
MEQTTANQGIDEGVIKYDCDWELTSPLAEAAIQQLITWRDALYRLGLIGVTPDGIGFGNISQRIGQSEQFVITGTQTGHLPQLQPQHYTVVTQFDLEQNTLICRGPIKASSESLTHAAIYTHQPTV